MAGPRRTVSGPRRRRAEPLSAKLKKRADSIPEFGPLRTYTIFGLFGREKFGFDLDRHEPTLLTGVNGTGKSTILRSIDAISAENWMALTEIPFEQIRLGFSNIEIVITKSTSDGLISVRLGDFPEWSFHYGHRVRIPRSMVLEAKRAGMLVGEDSDGFYAIPSSDKPEVSDLWLHMSDHDFRQIPAPWIGIISNRFPVLFVTDQRLVVEVPERPTGGARTEKTPTRVAVVDAARQVYAEIQRAKSRYATVAQERDSDFPMRVVEAMTKKKSNRRLSSLANNLNRLADLRKGLEATGLLAADEAPFSGEQLRLDEPSVHAVIDIYVQDTLAKLETLEPLRRRLELFTAFLNQHYSSKRVVIDQDAGFRIVMRKSEETLPPDRLSSGEQQMLVLAHKILFDTKAETLVLIDEPELSLHVVWQATFVDDLARMGQVDDLTFLLATHSPTLINGREDLKRSLDVL